jgi:signal transduction histidine kinase
VKPVDQDLAPTYEELEGDARASALLTWSEDHLDTTPSAALEAARAAFEAARPESALRHRAARRIARALYGSGEVSQAYALALDELEACRDDPTEHDEHRYLLACCQRRLHLKREAEETLVLLRQDLDTRPGGDARDDLISRVHNLQGLLYLSQSRHEESLEAFHASLAALEGAPDEDGVRMSRAIIHNNIGLIYREQNLHERAIEHYQTALEVMRSTSGRGREGTILLNVGFCHKSLGRIDEAMSAFDEATALFVAGGYESELLLVDRVRAEAHLARGEAEEARALLAPLLERWSGQEDRLSRCRALTSMGQALAGLGRDEEAERSWDEALELAEELEQIEPRLRVAEHRVAFLESRGRFEEALAWHRSLHELNRQQVDSARSSQMTQLEARYELESKRREAQRSARQARELERLVHERTAELEVARDAAEAANRAKSSILATTSHELRTPLNAIIGYSEMVLEELGAAPEGWEAKGDCAADVRQVITSAHHLLSKVDKILQLSSLEAGGTRAVPAPVRVPEVLSSLCEGFDAVRASSEVELRRDWGALTEDEVETDAHMLRAILYHLLENALTFTGRGAVCLRAHDERDADGRRWLVAQVVDSGEGVDPEVEQRLHEAFVRHDDRTERIHDGLGLGLTLCQRYSALLGGSLRLVEPDDAEMTTAFELRVPV